MDDESIQLTKDQDSLEHCQKRINMDQSVLRCISDWGVFIIYVMGRAGKLEL